MRRPDGRGFVLDRPEAELVFEGLREEPVPSLLRDFSAPVRLDLPLTDAQRLRLLARDSDRSTAGRRRRTWRSA